MPETGSAFRLRVILNFIARYLTRVLQGMLNFYGSMNIHFKPVYAYSSGYNLKPVISCVLAYGAKVEELFE
jgi:thiamine transporter ThiT